MEQDIRRAAEAVLRMDEHLRSSLLIKDGVLQEKKIWENIFIKHQADRRKRGEIFTLQDHLRAMVYSMLSAGIRWEQVEPAIDMSTGRISSIDMLFHQYDIEYLHSCNPDDLSNNIIKELHFGSPYTAKQMAALVNTNLPKLTAIEKQYGNVDDFYSGSIQGDPSMKTLVRVLSDVNSEYKLEQMGEALTAEYLRNAGYDLAKPDRHTCRILGRDRLGCSEKQSALPYEVIDIVADIAKLLERPAAEVDYILWSYCAKGYGGICEKKKPKCETCAAAHYCRIQREKYTI